MATTDFGEDAAGDFESVEDEILAYYQDHPVAWAEDVAGLTVPENQADLLNMVADDEEDKILLISGNALGKTGAATIAGDWHFCCFWNSFTMITSGNYDVMTDTSFRFLETIHERAKREHELDWPGVTKQSPPRIEIDRPGYSEWFLRYISPRHARNLQGRHARKSLVIVEEADKPDITREHISSAYSTASDAQDTMLVLANPPQSKSNCVYDLMEDPTWTVIRWDWTDSHNVQRQLGEVPKSEPEIGGLVDLERVRDDWESMNRRPWPGVEEAAVAHPDLGGDEYANLNPEWYRMRMGRMAKGGTSTLRPFYERDVQRAVDRWEPWMEQEVVRLEDVDDEDFQDYVRDGVGADLARDGGDRTVIVDRHHDPPILSVFANLQAGDHTVNNDVIDEAATTGTIDGWFWLDALGEGSGSADRAQRDHPPAKRFQASEEAQEGSEYYDRRTEAMVHLGVLLKTDEIIVPPNSDLEDELIEGARTLRLEKRHRGSDTVLNLKGKDDLKDSSKLGRSPDILDAAALASYVPYPRTDYRDPSIGGVVG